MYQRTRKTTEGSSWTHKYSNIREEIREVNNTKSPYILNTQDEKIFDKIRSHWKRTKKVQTGHLTLILKLGKISRKQG